MNTIISEVVFIEDRQRLHLVDNQITGGAQRLTTQKALSYGIQVTLFNITDLFHFFRFNTNGTRNNAGMQSFQIRRYL